MFPIYSHVMLFHSFFDHPLDMRCSLMASSACQGLSIKPQCHCVSYYEIWQSTNAIITAGRRVSSKINTQLYRSCQSQCKLLFMHPYIALHRTVNRVCLSIERNFSYILQYLYNSHCSRKSSAVSVQEVNWSMTLLLLLTVQVFKKQAKV